MTEKPTCTSSQTQPGTGVGQGHQDQFVAEMAQWGMPLDKKFIVEGKACTFADFVHYTKGRARVTTKQELAHSLILLEKSVAKAKPGRVTKG